MPNGFQYGQLPQEYSSLQLMPEEDVLYDPTLGGGGRKRRTPEELEAFGGQVGGVTEFVGEEIAAFGETAQYLAQPLPDVENIYAGLGAEVKPDVAYLEQQQQALQALPTGKGVGFQVLGGAAKGAAAGSAFGGVGALIGGAVGAIGAGIRGGLGKKKARADISEMQEELEQARAGFGAQMRRYNELQTRQEMEGIQQMYNQMLRQNIYAR